MYNLSQKRRAFHAEIRQKHHQNYRDIIRQSLVKGNQTQSRKQAFKSIQFILNGSFEVGIQKHFQNLFMYICQTESNRNYVLTEILEQGIISRLFRKYNNFILPLFEKMIVCNTREDLAQLIAEDLDFVAMITQKIGQLSRCQIYSIGIYYVKIFNAFAGFVSEISNQAIHKLTEQIIFFPFIDSADQQQQIKFYANLCRIAMLQKVQISQLSFTFRQRILRLIQLYGNSEKKEIKNLSQDALFYLSITTKYQYNEHFDLIKQLLIQFTEQRKLKFIDQVASLYIWFEYESFQLDVHLKPLLEQFLFSDSNKYLQEKILCIRIIGNLIVNSEYDIQTAQKIAQNLHFDIILQLSYKQSLKQQLSYLVKTFEKFFCEMLPYYLSNQQQTQDFKLFEQQLKFYLKTLKVIARSIIPQRVKEQLIVIINLLQAEKRGQNYDSQCQERDYQLQSLDGLSEGSSLYVNIDKQQDEVKQLQKDQTQNKTFKHVNNPQSGSEDEFYSVIAVENFMDEQRGQN